MKHKHFTAVLAALLLCLLLPVAAFAETGSLTVSFPVDGIPFCLYRVGRIDNGVVLDDPFAAYFPDGIPNDPAAAASAAARLAPIAAASEVTPATGTTASGRLTFANLSAGMYLLTAEAFTEEGGAQYYPIPMLISIPGRGADGGIDWNVTVTAKYTATLDISVIKVWKNDTPANRPKAILVQLTKNGEAEGIPVLLTPENDWRYTWENLDPTMEYSVDEVTKLSSYTATKVQQGNVIQITNTRNTPPPPHLPQTGQLWWPVTVMGLGGMLLLLLGIARKRRNSQ